MVIVPTTRCSFLKAVKNLHIIYINYKDTVLTLSCPGTGRAVVKIGHSNLKPGSKELSVALNHAIFCIFCFYVLYNRIPCEFTILLYIKDYSSKRNGRLISFYSHFPVRDWLILYDTMIIHQSASFHKKTLHWHAMGWLWSPSRQTSLRLLEEKIICVIQHLRNIFE